MEVKIDNYLNFKKHFFFNQVHQKIQEIISFLEYLDYR
jgi:hypothetical protein